MSERIRKGRIGLAVLLVVVVIGGGFAVWNAFGSVAKTRVTAFFDNSNGIFVGDEVRILGVPVGKIDRIEPQAKRAKISFWVDSKYAVPADVKAVILSPSLVTSRAIQLTPAYKSGTKLLNDAVIPQDRTAVPVEWDDFRQQLQKLTETLQPTQPGGVSTLGAVINTAADNLRGQGANIHDTLTKLSQAMSALGDHSGDLFSTVKSLSTLVSALQSSSDLMRQLNVNLAATTGLLTNQPDEVGNAVTAINSVMSDVKSFVGDNREALGTTTDKLASISTALNDSLGDIKQTLHVAPTTFQNYLNIYQPAQGTLSGALAINNFANPISFICGGIQAASRLNWEQSSKLCVQYLAPIIKNRQFNFPPLGENLFVGPSARPNEVTYSEDWMRPDYVPPPAPRAPDTVSPHGGPPAPPLLAAEAAVPPADAAKTNSAGGLQGMMMPEGAGS